MTENFAPYVKFVADKIELLKSQFQELHHSLEFKMVKHEINRSSNSIELEELEFRIKRKDALRDTTKWLLLDSTTYKS
jgi:hypothetical protein